MLQINYSLQTISPGIWHLVETKQFRAWQAGPKAQRGEKII